MCDKIFVNSAYSVYFTTFLSHAWQYFVVPKQALQMKIITHHHKIMKTSQVTAQSKWYILTSMIYLLIQKN